MTSPPTLDRLTPGTVLWAGAAAAMTGAGLTALMFGLGVGPLPGMGLPGLVLMPPAFLLSFPAWQVGLAVIGGPCWWMLHSLGARSRRAAAAAGALLTFAVAGGYAALTVQAEPARALDPAWTWALTFAGGMAAAGGAAGWVLAQTAYPQGPRP